MTASLFLHQVIDASSRVVPGASLTFMQGFRKGEIYHDPERRTPARNPIRTDSAGRVRLYMNAGETYEVTVECPDGTRQQFVHVARASGETITETVEVDRVVYVADPAALARIDELEAMLAKQIPELAEPVPVEIPAFLAEPAPSELSDLVRESEPHGETKVRLWRLYVDLQSRIADNGKSMDPATAEQFALHSRLSRHLDWIRGSGAIDVI